MRKNLFVILFSVSALLAVSCSVSRHISVRQGYTCFIPDTDGAIAVDVELGIPSKYISDRSRLIIQPIMESRDTIYDKVFSPLVIDAPLYIKKKHRAEVLENYTDTLDTYAIALDTISGYVRYLDSIILPGKIEYGKFYATIKSEGCGNCRIVDTIPLGAINDPVTLLPIEESLILDWIEPIYVLGPKIRYGHGEAKLQFLINKYEIDLDLPGNRLEMENMLRKLKQVSEDTLAVLNSVKIYGVASADGSFAFNTALSRNRANSAKDWLVSQLGFDSDEQNVFSVSSKPEGWWPVFTAMSAAGDKDSLAVLEIIKGTDGTENDDIYEKAIRNLPCWSKIREKYLQKDRKVEYTYTYTIKSFTTDQELERMYSLRPDAFSESEFLRLTVVKENNEDKAEVYRTMLHYFPQSSTAANNLAVLYLREGNEQAAREVLDVQSKFTEEMINTKAASYVYSGEYEKAAELIEECSVRNRQAAYNLGLLKIKMRELDEGYELLRSYRDVNSAIAALCVDRNSEALEIMMECKKNTPLSYYVMALAAARLGDEKIFSENIVPALKDEGLKKRAAYEYDFAQYRENKQFKSVMSEE